MFNKIVLWIILAGILILTFFLQIEFYKQSLNGIAFAVGIILVFDIIKVFSEIHFFQSRKILHRLSFGLIAIMLISFSVFATFSTRVYLSESRESELVAQKTKVDRDNESIWTQRELLRTDLNVIDSQISQKQDIMRDLSQDIKNKWLILRLNKEIGELQKKRETVSKDLKIQANQKETTLVVSSISENIEKIIGIHASSINLLVYLFQSILLETGVFVIAFFLGIGKKEGIISTNESKETQEEGNFNDSDNNNNGNGNGISGQKLREIRTQLGKSQDEMAKELGIHQMKLSRLENGKGKVDKSILDRLVGLNML